MVIKTGIKNAFLEDDLGLSAICDAENTRPEVNTFVTDLGRPRKNGQSDFPLQACSFLISRLCFYTEYSTGGVTPEEGVKLQTAFESYFAHEDGAPIISPNENVHFVLLMISDLHKVYNSSEGDHGSRPFKEELANASLFLPYACYLENRLKGLVNYALCANSHFSVT